jgi:hydrogenase maturation factor
MTLVPGAMLPTDVDKLIKGVIPVAEVESRSLGDGNPITVAHSIMTDPPELLGYLAANLPVAMAWSRWAKPISVTVNLLFPLGTEEFLVRRILTSLGKEMKRIGITASGVSISSLAGISTSIADVTVLGSGRKTQGQRLAKGDVIVIAGRPLAELALRCSHDRPDIVEAVGGNPKYLRSAYTKISAVEAAMVLYREGSKSIALMGDGGVVKAAKRISREAKGGLMFDVEKIQWDEVGLKIVQSLDGDPSSATSYGSLIAVLDKNEAEERMRSLAEQKVVVSAAGRVTGGVGVWKSSGGPMTQHKDVYSLISPTRSSLLL